jgi:hypothetical protein
MSPAPEQGLDNAAGGWPSCQYCWTTPNSSDPKSCLTEEQAFSCAWLDRAGREHILRRKKESGAERVRQAAPELLAAAKRALNYIENTEGELGITLDSGNALRAAIAKAEGRAISSENQSKDGGAP